MELTNAVRKPLVGLALAAALALAAPKSGAQEQKDLVDTAIQAGNLSRFTSLLLAAGLVDTLRGRGPYTVFAPTDDAFARIPKAELDALLNDKPRLAAVLRNHVVPGRMTAADIARMTSARTIAGDDLRIAFSGSGAAGPDPHEGLARAEAITKAANPERSAETEKAFAIVGAIAEQNRTGGRGLRVNNAGVVKADILATNGVIHTIDAVVMPR